MDIRANSNSIAALQAAATYQSQIQEAAVDNQANASTTAAGAKSSAPGAVEANTSVNAPNSPSPKQTVLSKPTLTMKSPVTSNAPSINTTKPPESEIFT